MGPNKAMKLPPLRRLAEEAALSLPQAERDELQAKSLAAFTWRTLEALRAAWGLAIPGGRVELVMYDFRHRCGYILSRPHIEQLPFPWPERRTVFYFYLPRSVWPVPMHAKEPRRALSGDGVSVRTDWIFQVVGDVLTTLGGGADRAPEKK